MLRKRFRRLYITILLAVFGLVLPMSRDSGLKYVRHPTFTNAFFYSYFPNIEQSACKVNRLFGTSLLMDTQSFVEARVN